MICVSLGDAGFEESRALARELGFVEIRLDLADLTAGQIDELFSMPARFVATCRANGRPNGERTDLLLRAIEAGAAFVDVEVESLRTHRRRIMDAARAVGCGTVVSFHDDHGTPDAGALKAIVERCFATGADIAKVACFANTGRDAARILSLYDADESWRGKLIAIGMGEMGRITRVAALFLGAPFTYAALAPGRETAPGQLDHVRLRLLLEEAGRG